MAAHGYVTDTHYTDQFFRELAPVWLNAVAALNGVRPRDVRGAFTYVELGCGFGTSTVVNAGAYPRGTFHGCDINPAHIAGARQHATALGIANVTFHEADFEQLLARGLPSCDFIVAHGVYSWVNAGARAAVRRVIAQLLKPAGLAYVSYNCLPGWAGEAPLRKLLVELAAAAEGDTAARTAHALGALTAFSRARPRYFNANPAAVKAIDAYQTRDTEYLVHEFMNEVWQPFYSVDVADEMADAGLTFVGSATLPENFPALMLDADSSAAVAAQPTDRVRQLATDFAVNRRFRRDVFVRGDGAASQAEALQDLYGLVVGSARPTSAIGARATVPRGEIGFHEEFIRDLRALMATGSMPIGEAVATLAGRAGDPDEIARNVVFLVAAGVLMPFVRAHAVDAAADARLRPTPMFARVLAQAVDETSARAVPCEVMGNGFPLDAGDARAVRDALAGSGSPPAKTRELLATLARVGLLERDHDG